MDAIWDQSSHFIVGNFRNRILCMQSDADEWAESGCVRKTGSNLMQWKVLDALLRVWACMRLMNFVWRFCFLVAFFSRSLHLFLPKILISKCNELDFHLEFVCLFWWKVNAFAAINFACINVCAWCWVPKTLLSFSLAYLKPKTMNVNQISLKQPLEKKNPTATRDRDTRRIKAIPVNRSEPKNTSWSHLLDVCSVLRCRFFPPLLLLRFANTNPTLDRLK